MDLDKFSSRIQSDFELQKKIQDKFTGGIIHIYSEEIECISLEAFKQIDEGLAFILKHDRTIQKLGSIPVYVEFEGKGRMIFIPKRQQKTDDKKEQTNDIDKR